MRPGRIKCYPHMSLVFCSIAYEKKLIEVMQIYKEPIDEPFVGDPLSKIFIHIISFMKHLHPI